MGGMAVNAELAAQGSVAGGRSVPAPLCPFSSSRRGDEPWALLETQLGEMQRGTAGGLKSKGLSAAGGANAAAQGPGNAWVYRAVFPRGQCSPAAWVRLQLKREKSAFPPHWRPASRPVPAGLQISLED